MEQSGPEIGRSQREATHNTETPIETQTTGNPTTPTKKTQNKPEQRTTNKRHEDKSKTSSNALR